MYNESMARGWESKAVDDQIQDANETRKNGNPRNLSPEQIDAVRQRKVLELSRIRVTSDLENNQDPRYRSLLLRALEDLDAQIARLKSAGNWIRRLRRQHLQFIAPGRALRARRAAI